ncbi:MAG: penicillin-binding protein 2 [Desulfobacteraceae bacterium 4572_87]|nr:MAG: penicillin-binding protein 2 [Desulfobacteraceae bacterium 4572_87]
MKTSNFDPVSQDVFAKQLKIAVIFVLVIFGILILRLWFLQIVSGSAYRDRSENNRIRLQSMAPFRGVIRDGSGEILVDNRPSYDLYVIPEEIQNGQDLLNRLTALGKLEMGPIKDKIHHAARGYPFKPVCLKKDISREELAMIETRRFDLPGVMIKVRPQRHYFYGDLAAHVLGYLGEISEKQLRSGKFPNNRQGDLIGKTGIEWRWQQSLNGGRGGEQVEVDAAGRRIKVISQRPPVSGADVCLTINRELQMLAENALDGKHGAIVAMDPRNGQILALASSPSYDPNLFITGFDNETWKTMVSSSDYPLHNRALTGQYPPGSIFKIVVALAGLQEGVISPQETLYCNGKYSLGRGKYRCWKRWGHGKVNLNRALVESCDVYFYNLGMRLGVDRIARYARQLGLGKKTGLNLGHEKGGLIPTSEWKRKRWGVPWQGGETVSTAIGQSFVLVTPLQVATFVSAVFNGGHVYKPQVTRWVRKPGGESIFEFTPQLIRDVEIRPEYLEIVKHALSGVVNHPRGTGKKAKLADITVAGKTGTAQVVNLKKEKEAKAKGEIPWKYRDHAWFVAVAPVDAPRITVAVLIEHGGHGGSAAAPIAKTLIEAYLRVPVD